jgi:NADH dehydrogenase
MIALDNLPGVAEVAMQSGIHAAWTIRRRIHNGAPSKPFKYRDLGSMATVSRFRAIVSFKGIRVAGFIGWLMWAFIHLTFLTGFKNRFRALVKWFFAFVGRARGERTITLQQVSARVIAMEAGLTPGEPAIAIPDKGDTGVSPSAGSTREPT